jgi:small subunit ribosomal protein S1
MGDLVEGVVHSVQPYGVYLDIGAGVTGLLHISNVSDDHIAAEDVAKIFAAGDKVKVSGL